MFLSISKQKGIFNIQLILIFLVGALVLVAGSYSTGYFKGKSVQIEKYKQKITKLNTLLSEKKKESDERLQILQTVLSNDKDKTQEIINRGIKDGGWWNEKAPETANSVVWPD